MVERDSGTFAPGLAESALAYDPALTGVVLYGGIGSSTPTSNETWLYRNGSWANLTSSYGEGPGARLASSLVYDSANSSFYLLGGSSIGESGYPTNPDCTLACRDAWRLTSSGWTQLTVPQAPFHHPPDTLGNNVSVLGGVSAYDATNRQTLFVEADASGDNSFGNTSQGQTWAVNGSTWTGLSGIGASNSSAVSPNYLWPALVDDPAAHGVLLFGGERFSSGGSWGYWASNSTWLFTNGSWVNETGLSAASPRRRWGILEHMTR